MHKNKRGLSPVIATVLLVLLALVLALIIFLWVRSWLGEKIQKDLGEGAILIEEACKSVGFKAEVAKGIDGSVEVLVENTKNVPIYGVKLIKVSKGSKKTLGTARYPLKDPSLADTPGAIRAGETYVFKTSSVGESEFGDSADKIEELVPGQNVTVRPVIVGLAKSVRREHVCSDEDITVNTEVV